MHSIRVLLIEDNPADVRLIRESLDECADACGVGDGPGLIFPLLLVGLGGEIEAAHGIVASGPENEGECERQRRTSGLKFHLELSV